jgi:hypothetical protein
MAIGSSRSLLPLRSNPHVRFRTPPKTMTPDRPETHALVTQATSGANPSMWSFSFSNLAEDTNIGK